MKTSDNLNLMQIQEKLQNLSIHPVSEILGPDFYLEM